MGEMYFPHDTLIGRILRFLNLLEPGPKMVLSISKFYMWASVFVTVYVSIAAPDNLAAVLAAGGNQIVAIGNYAYRRLDQRLREMDKQNAGTD